MQAVYMLTDGFLSQNNKNCFTHVFDYHQMGRFLLKKGFLATLKAEGHRRVESAL